MLSAVRSAVVLALLAGCNPLPLTPSGGGMDGGPSGPGMTGPGPSGPGPSGPGPAMAGGELCGNGIDDDNDRMVDDGCLCTVGATQACWVGQRVHRGVGECRDGRMTCQDMGGGRSAWGACSGNVAPAAEVPGDMKDQDCNGADATPGCTAAEFENCTNGVDDDCDGLVDNRDWDSGCSTCNPAGFTIGRACKGRDFDCGGPISCTDMACRGGNEIDCRDSYDNDCDGMVDCMDADCIALGVCGTPPGGPNPGPSGGMPGTPDSGTPTTDSGIPPSPPDSGTPPSSDGGTPSWWPFPPSDGGSWMWPSWDASTPEEPRMPQEDRFGFCQCVPGAWRWCDTPTGCLWGIQDCSEVGRWGPCNETGFAPSLCADDYYYNTDCCVAAGECCMNYPNFTGGSVGNCQGSLECR